MTATETMQEELEELGWGPNAELISTSAVHKLASPSAIQHQYVPLQKADGMDKMEALVEHFHASREKPVLVFIHRGASITQFVNEKGCEISDTLFQSCESC